MSKIAVFPGTFDPITLGHISLAQRAAHLFDKLIVAVAENTVKTPCFPLDQRIQLAATDLQSTANIVVTGFNNLLVDFLQEVNATVIIRGLRVVSDFEYEFQLANTNRHLSPSVETMFLTAHEHNSWISSSLVREVASLGGKVDKFVTSAVADAIYMKFNGSKDNRRLY